MNGEALYERYKEALKRGHVASLRGRVDEALLAYADAARIAPDRSTPHTSAGTALLRRTRPADALRHYENAIRLAPSDEAALLGRAQALSAMDRRLDAADAFDALAEQQASSGRLAAAVDAARRGLELAEGRDRRRTLERLIARLRTSEPGEPGRLALERALRVLEGSAAPPPSRRSTGDDAPELERDGMPVAATEAADEDRVALGLAGAAGVPIAELAAQPVDEMEAESGVGAAAALAWPADLRGRRGPRTRTGSGARSEDDAASGAGHALGADPVVESGSAPGGEPVLETGADGEPKPGLENTPEPGLENTPEPGLENTPEPGLENTPEPEPDVDAEGEPGTEPEPEPEPVAAVAVRQALDRDVPEDADLEAMVLEAELLLDSADPSASARFLDLAAASMRAGKMDAALDACYQALSLDPDDVGLHLALVQLYDERGWAGLANEKLELLGRLIDLGDDPEASVLVGATRAARG